MAMTRRTVPLVYTPGLPWFTPGLWNGEQFWELSSIPGSYSGDPIDLKIIRNPKTNAIEKLEEMSKSETKEALNYRPDWFEKVLDGSEDLNTHILQLAP